MAGHIKGYSKAAKHFNIRAVCGVGMMGTGERIDDLRKAVKIPENIPVFSLQGGFDINKLKGFYKWSMSLMSKGLCDEIAKKENPSKSDLEMVEILKNGGSYVCRDNLRMIVEYVSVMDIQD